MPAPLLRLSGTSKSFGGNHALNNVSFDLFAGEVHGLVGENGAGKSTLVQIITGAQQPDAGKMEIQGRPHLHLNTVRARELGVACVYQHPALFPDLTVAENIELRVKRWQPFGRIEWSAMNRRARSLLEQLGAEIPAQAVVRELSMPQQQLVEIGCALGSQARVVVMDEPTASLTQREQGLLFAIVRELRRNNVGVIYVSHKLEEIFALADRVTVLRDGSAVGTCRTNDLSEPMLIRMMVGRELGGAKPKVTAATRPVILSVKNLSRVGSGVLNISFELRAGEIFGVAGLVGAGRTELARILFGITPADSGEVVLQDRRIQIDSPGAAVREGIGYVPEDRTRHGIIPSMAVAANISMANHKRLFPGGWLRPKAEATLAREFIDALDIRPPWAGVPASELSGGNQQKVALARWLAIHPKVLILDEPTQGVDVGAKSQIHDLIIQLAGRGLAVMLISSDLTELLALSHRIGVMRSGQMVTVLAGQSAPQEVMAAAFGQTAVLG